MRPIILAHLADSVTCPAVLCGGMRPGDSERVYLLDRIISDTGGFRFTVSPRRSECTVTLLRCRVRYARTACTFIDLCWPSRVSQCYCRGQCFARMSSRWKGANAMKRYHEGEWKPISGQSGPTMQVDLRLIPIVLLSALFVAWVVLGGPAYTVAADEEAVVLTFGRYTTTTQPGLNFKFPWPIQTVEKVKVGESKRLEIGFRSEGAGDRSATCFGPTACP